MYEDCRLIVFLAVVPGTIANIHIPLPLLKDLIYAQHKASGLFGCGSYCLIGEVCWWRADDGRTAMALSRAVIILWLATLKETKDCRCVPALRAGPLGGCHLLTNSADQCRVINKTRDLNPASVTPVFSLEPSFSSICHYMMVMMSCLGFSIGWALFTRSAWTVQLKSRFEREREISGDSSMAPMLLYYFFTSSHFHLSQSDQKPKICVCIRTMENRFFSWSRAVDSPSVTSNLSSSVRLANRKLLNVLYTLQRETEG